MNVLLKGTISETIIIAFFLILHAAKKRNSFCIWRLFCLFCFFVFKSVTNKMFQVTKASDNKLATGGQLSPRKATRHKFVTMSSQYVGVNCKRPDNFALVCPLFCPCLPFLGNQNNESPFQWQSSAFFSFSVSFFLPWSNKRFRGDGNDGNVTYELAVWRAQVILWLFSLPGFTKAQNI